MVGHSDLFFHSAAEGHSPSYTVIPATYMSFPLFLLPSNGLQTKISEFSFS
jgi:hypothetical protein